MKNTDTFAEQLLLQRAKFTHLAESHLFEITQEQIERAFAPAAKPSSRVEND